MTSWDFLVDRNNLTNTTVVNTAPRALDGGEARLRVDAFGFTANNITYAVFGDMIGYWNFFPVPDQGDDTNWGRVPVWGFADVVESKAEGLTEGARVYGYLPMSTELIVTPGRVTDTYFVDAVSHRSVLPPTYNRYSFTTGDQLYSSDLEPQQMLLRPLFMTGFVIDVFLADKNFFDASTVIATSASSKTAIAAAHLIDRREGLRVVGLTSDSNVEFVENLGCYDQVISYDQLADGESLADGSAVLIDFAGDAAVVRAVHEQLTDRLAYSSRIGGTHWDAGADESAPLPGPTPEFFFAPTIIEELAANRGADDLDHDLGEAWLPFVERLRGALSVQYQSGSEAVRATYLDHLAGTASPSVGTILQPGG